jgi:hypothetical protein
MKREELVHVLATLSAAAIVCAVAMAVLAVASYFEAQSYNRVTGANVSTWDAMWLDLRVQEQTKDTP